MLNLKNLYPLKLALLTISILVSSCGFVSDKAPTSAEVYKSSELQSCKIDLDQISQIFKTNQKNQILCLQDNFNQYIKYIRNENPNSISETEMREFVIKMYPNQNASISKALNILFQLNMILFGDEKGHIARENIAPLFEFLTILNQEAVAINQITTDMKSANGQENFWKNRDLFIASVTHFSDVTIEIIKNSKGTNQTVKIKQFILNIASDLGITNINEDMLDSLIFSKKLLLFGEKENITSSELKLLIAGLPKISTLLYDLNYARPAYFSTDEELARFRLVSIRSLYNVIQFEQENFLLFSIDQLVSTLTSFTKNNNINNFKISIASLKRKIIGGNQDLFSLTDLKKILDIYHEYTEKYYFNIVTYNAYNEVMKSNEIITSLEQLDLPEKYDLFSPQRLKTLHDDFRETTLKTRYFRDKVAGLPYFGKEVRRTKYGFLQSDLTNFIISKLLYGYGHRDQTGRLQLSVVEFKIFLSEMEPVLKEFKLWSPDANFAQNTILMADLFQSTSNGDLDMNSTEATEYTQLAYTSTDLAKKMGNKFSNMCDIGMNQNDPIVETQCYNDNYFELLLNDLNYKNFLPNLNKFIESSSHVEKTAYLEAIEGFARENPNPEIPVNLRESSLIIGSMLNIESTFLRFDTNNDNIIDYEELGAAFNIYKNMIISIAKLSPKDEVYAKSVFLYMVTKAKPPPTGGWMNSARFYSYHKCVSSDFCRKIFLKKIEAKRINIGNLLSYVAKSKKF